MIGGGDTGADCIGTAIRQGAASVTQLEIMPRPPETRPGSQPWPTFPMLFKMESAHEELAEGGGDRVYAVSTTEFVGDDDGNVRALRLVEVEGPGAGSSRSPAPSGRSRPSWSPCRWASSARRRAACCRSSPRPPETSSSTPGATSPATSRYMSSVDGVFVAGDMGRGQSLIVWAIAEGRSAASAADRYLTGQTALPGRDPADRPAAGLTTSPVLPVRHARRTGDAGIAFPAVR